MLNRANKIGSKILGNIDVVAKKTNCYITSATQQTTDHSCFVTMVHREILYLAPQDSSFGFPANCTDALLGFKQLLVVVWPDSETPIQVPVPVLPSCFIQISQPTLLSEIVFPLSFYGVYPHPFFGCLHTLLARGLQSILTNSLFAGCTIVKFGHVFCDLACGTLFFHGDIMAKHWQYVKWFFCALCTNLTRFSM